MSFQELNLNPRILDALSKANYAQPTPIQAQAIPAILQGRDLLGNAQTGTGKTAAFAVPVIQLLMNQPVRAGKTPIRALVLTPTRELALQIFESFQAYARFTRLKACVVFGGVSQVPQVKKLQRGVDILVATPGRLGDLMNQGYIRLDQVSHFVLDEADRMLDMGFIGDVRKILAKMPQSKQTLLFSATMPQEIKHLADELLTDPEHVQIAPEAPTVEKIEQRLCYVDKANKRALLLHLLQDESLRSVLVFTRTRHGADRVVKELEAGGVRSAAIHSDKSQTARQNALSGFKRGDVRVLVATDIASRGIDIEELSCVINYDLPDAPETYVHRIGRTGRAGMEGIAISFCCVDEKKELLGIQRMLGGKIPVADDHPYPMLVTTPTPKAGKGRPSASAPRQGAAASRAPQRMRAQGGQRAAGRAPQRARTEEQHAEGRFPKRTQAEGQRPTRRPGAEVRNAKSPGANRPARHAQRG